MKQAKDGSNIHAIKDWPVGSLMQFDNRRSIYENLKFRYDREPTLWEIEKLSHQGLGIVIANDGNGTIYVVWGSNCQEAFAVYSVKHLNEAVISRVLRAE